MALERKWDVERCSKSKRLFHGKHGTKSSHSLHSFLRTAAPRLCHQRRSSRARSKSFLLEKQSLSDQQVHGRIGCAASAMGDYRAAFGKTDQRGSHSMGISVRENLSSRILGRYGGARF